jgi:hypothetical protein
MPRAARFYSYIPPVYRGDAQEAVLQRAATHGSSGLYSTFAIFQNNNLSNNTHSVPDGDSETAIDQNLPTPEAFQQPLPEQDNHFLNLYRRWRNKYDLQFPDTPCAYCATLMLPRNIAWVEFGPEVMYGLTVSFQLPVTQRTKNGVVQVAICKTCKTESQLPVNTGPWPEVLLSLPHRSKMFLSPLMLQTSLGRTQSHQAVHNPYSTYRTVTGRMNITHNPRAVALFSGSIGAYLESSQNTIDRGHDLTHLKRCRSWLLTHNPIYRRYDVRSELNISPLPTAELSNKDSEIVERPLGRPDIVLNPEPYDLATQNEDHRHFRLPVASVTDSHGTSIGLVRSDPAIELLLFPLLYPHGHGQWIRPAKIDRVRGKNTLLQDTQRKLNSAISHFREDHYWPAWIYMEIEAIRIFQNNQRIISSRTRQSLDRRMPASDLLQQSAYGPWSVINEKLTTTIPHFIRTGDTYFIEGGRKVNAMLNAYKTPNLFITTTFSERWAAYQKILATTGSGNQLPSDRPWDAIQYYYERIYWLKKEFFRKPQYSKFGVLKEMVERHEFQLRQAIHTHNLLWTEKSTEELIQNGYIRADLPNPDLEPLLYELVQKFQVHTCAERFCGGPQAPTGKCRKGFPADLSNRVFQKDQDLRYTYKRLSEADCWIVPYNAELLLLYEGHVNVQYCTTGGLATYISKYVTKAEPKSIVNVNSSNHTTSHLLARRMGSMECMVLLLGFCIFHMTSGSMYLPTAMPTMRNSTVKPVHLLEEDPQNPYFADALEKYFARPSAEGLDHCTYFKYFSNYAVYSAKQGRRRGWKDRNGYFVYPRTKVCI